MPKNSLPLEHFPKNFDELIGHHSLVKGFSTARSKGRLAGSLLFVGPPGVGKTSTALLLAQTLLCSNSNHSSLNACGHCASCTQVRAATHPDLIQLRKPEEKTLIPLELLIGPVDARLREGFCHDIHLRPMQAERKVAILHDADFLNEEGANCLLKTLEEPPANALMILIGTSEQKQLPTIRSRCQTMRFLTPTGEDGRRLLRRKIEVEHQEKIASEDANAEVPNVNNDDLDSALELSAGDLQVAVRLALGQNAAIRNALLGQLTMPVPDPAVLARLINEHLDSVSKKEPAKRRAALRDVCAIAVQHYRQRLREDASLGGYDTATHHRLDRSLRVFREIDRSANLGTLVDCYAADLTLATTGDRGQIG